MAHATPIGMIQSAHQAGVVQLVLCSGPEELVSRIIIHSVVGAHYLVLIVLELLGRRANTEVRRKRNKPITACISRAHCHQTCTSNIRGHFGLADIIKTPKPLINAQYYPCITISHCEPVHFRVSFSQITL